MSTLRFLPLLTAFLLATPGLAVASAASASAHAPAYSPADPGTVLEGARRASSAVPATALVHDPDDPFYLPPADLPDAPGQLIRTEPATHLLNVAGPDFPGHAYRILYTSTTMLGETVATSGFVIEPARRWAGAGTTPTLVFAPGTRGADDSCAPSRGPWLTGFYPPVTQESNPNYELAFYYDAALHGMRVVVVDYIGLGTPGVHTYVNSVEEAHAVLDAARAVAPAGGPVGFSGYSQGGQAAAAAAELAADYAPELDVRGTYAGAAAGDLGMVMHTIDGSELTGVMGYAIAGFAARDPATAAEIDTILTPGGRDFVRDNLSNCVRDSAREWGGRDTRPLTTTGQRLSEAVATLPRVRHLIDEQRLGRLQPNAPILLTSVDRDEIIPNEQVRELGRDYCATGAQVLYRTNAAPPRSSSYHAYGLIADHPVALDYLIDRFNGVPAPDNCGTF